MKYFINPNGILCATIVLFGKELFTMIDISFEFMGEDVNGDIINHDDYLAI